MTIGLWMTGQLGLYINPDGAWFAVTMAIIALVGCAVSFALPRGAEADHGHDHGDPEHGHDDHGHDGHGHAAVGRWTAAAAVSGGILATGIVGASVFATATNPESFDGSQVTLTGFVTPGDDGFALTRLVITHCVIDAQPASVRVASSDAYDTGQWVTVTGTIRDDDGRLAIHASSVEQIAEPKDPYEY